jgi:serine/threonine protein kinase
MTIASGSLVAGRYRLGELVGRGGMADVFRAHDERLGRPVALKLLRDHTGSSADRERFAVEARTLARLDHPAIVTLLDAGLESDQPWLVMQFVEGATLATRVAGSPLPAADVALIGRQLSEGLASAHAEGVVHRDVKPANVLLTADRRALLADFGIARLLDSAARHTAVGQAIGSPAYLAPEQASGGEVSGATDVYALGLLLLEALTGERAFRGTTTEVVYARLQGPPDVPSTVPPGWASLLREMTALAPADRPAAEAVARRLGAFDGEDLADDELVAADPDATAPFDVARDTGSGPAVDPEGTRLVTSPGGAAEPSTHGLRAAPRAVVVAGVLLAVLVAALLIWLALRDTGSGAEPEVPPVPSGVPAGLQDELSDLHDAIHGSPR